MRAARRARQLPPIGQTNPCPGSLIAWFDHHDSLVALNTPKIDEVLAEAISKIRRERPGLLERDSLKSDFSEAVEAVFEAASDAYKDHEKLEIDRFVQRSLSGWDETISLEDVKAGARAMLHGIADLERSRDQPGESRDSKIFERVVQELLVMSGVSRESASSVRSFCHRCGSAPCECP